MPHPVLFDQRTAALRRCRLQSRAESLTIPDCPTGCRCGIATCGTNNPGDTMLCDRCWLMLGGLLAGLAVGAGAFAAHGLDRHFHQKYAGMLYEKKVTVGGTETIVASIPLAQKYLADFKTGAEYQMYHGLALLAVGLVAMVRPSKRLTVAGCCFLAGCAGFSGGLYLYTLTDTKWVGMFVVPTGGLMFLIGWGAFIAAIGARNGSEQPLTQLKTDAPPR